MSDFSDVVNTSDTGNDFACTEDFNSPPLIEDFQPAFFTRWGTVGTYAAAANINSQAAYNAVLATPGYDKVVNSISFCDGFGANIIGCAPIGGTSMTVVRWTDGLEGILWAHEYGHTVGLEGYFSR